MVSAFHKLRNARTPLKNLPKRDDVEVVMIYEQLGFAAIAFRMREDASMTALKGIDYLLERNGWEEVDSHSQIGGIMLYEWDKLDNLTD